MCTVLRTCAPGSSTLVSDITSVNVLRNHGVNLQFPDSHGRVGRVAVAGGTAHPRCWTGLLEVRVSSSSRC